LVEHTLTTFKMYLSRRLAPAAAVISLLITLSILVVVSFGEGFRTLVSREGWLKNTVSILSMEVSSSTCSNLASNQILMLSKLAGKAQPEISRIMPEISLMMSSQ